MELIANRFGVLRELGSGGMGTVYHVVDTLDGDRELALKTFRSDLPITQERRLRFREEFRAMARLRHPNTVEVYDCGFLDGQTEYLTMEYVPGQELSELLQAGTLEFAKIYDLTLQLLLALEFVHSRLYVHRDIKPGNLRVREDGVLKVIDFGLMEWSGSRSSASLIGTAAYMAPEVILGGPLDTASDLYSVGCVLYELVCGRPPFLGTKKETLQAHLFQTPEPLRAYRDDAPPGLEAIVRRLLARDLRERYATAAEVADDLARLAGVHRIRQDLAVNESYLVSDMMVGRAREFEYIEVLAHEAEHGRRRSVFIGGPAGVGKSRLMKEVLMQAKIRGSHVLHAECKPGVTPYEPMLHALRPLLSLSNADEVEAHREVLKDIELAAAELRSGQANLDKLRLADEVAQWLSLAGSRSSVVVAIDDLQWCDRPSLELLNHCIRNILGTRLLFVATVRSDETWLGSPLWFTVQDGQTERLELEPLGREQVRQLVESMLPRLQATEDFVRSLYAATAGNAFFVTEVLRDLMEQGSLVASEDHWALPSDWEPHALPSSVESAVRERLARLEPGVLEIARVAAVLGRSLDREALLALADVSEEGLFTAVEVLTERQFLTREDRRLVFPHDRVREALYADIPVERSRSLHQRAGEHLEGRYAGEIERHLHELTHHFSRGEDLLKALGYALQAGDQAKAAGADASAIDYWSQAINILESPEPPPREDRDALLFELQARIAENALALWPLKTVEMSARCREALESRDDPERVSRRMKRVVAVIERCPAFIRRRFMAGLNKPVVYRHEAAGTGLFKRRPSPAAWMPKLLENYVLGCVASGHAGQPLSGMSLGERALELLPVRGTPLEGAMCTAVAGCMQSAGHFDDMSEILIRARELLFDGDLEGQSFALSARVGAAVFSNYAVFQGQRFEQRLVDFGIAAVDELQKPDFYNQVWAYPCLWYAWTGRYEQAMAQLELIESNCRRIGVPPDPWVQYLKPYLAWQRGSFEEAQALISRALQYSPIERIMLAREHACVLAGHIHLALEEFGAAQERFAGVEKRARAAGMELLVIQALIGRGSLAAARGKFDEARSHLVEASERASSGPARNPLHYAIAQRTLAEVLIAADDFAAAVAALDHAREIVCAEEQDNLIEAGMLCRAEAELAIARGDTSEALACLSRAEHRFTEINNGYYVRTTRERRLSAGLIDSRPVRKRPQEHYAPSDSRTVEIEDQTVTDLRESDALDSFLLDTGGSRAGH
ncbi:protein kinase [Pseudenhygromyxa sp. WMMC2535]|uniref:serine/threonine-protein kinase n=1 Tax=Pseudenhygromyxa sp. WMMC2535 TaxID=2712867 RepID=UPI0015532876|nr:protein kinase [Pseudenhygromyxa sp. WMMC2535]NVB39704.1 protein kinase [Pseudenhygromyxa sp. WMMC2535]